GYLTAKGQAIRASCCASLLELCQCLAIAGAFGQHGTPEVGFLFAVAPLFGQRRQVAPREMAVDALVHTRELIGALERENAAPAALGAGTIAGLAPYDGLTEEQLAVVGIDGKALSTRLDRLLRLSPHLMSSGDQGVQLARDRISWRRDSQAVAKVVERLPPVL